MIKTGNELIGDINQCSLKQGQAAFWWLGQMGYAVKIGETILYFDMYLSENPERTRPPVLHPEQISNADYIIGSHDHGDHIDRQAWPAISVSSPGARFVVPGMKAEELSEALKINLDRFIGIDDGVTEELQGIMITGIAASHELLDRDAKTGRYPYMGYVVEIGGVVLFHAGDTCVYEGLLTKLKQWDKIDIMFLPINGRDGKRYRMGHIGNMTYQEAADLAGALKPGLAVAGHWDMFYGNGEDPALFADYYEAKYPGCLYWTGQNSADSGYLQYYLM